MSPSETVTLTIVIYHGTDEIGRREMQIRFRNPHGRDVEEVIEAVRMRWLLDDDEEINPHASQPHRLGIDCD